jgi:acyl carrier protein
MLQRATVEGVIASFSKSDLLESPTSGDSTFSDMGLDSLDSITALMALEDSWPSLDLNDYYPTSTTTVNDVVQEINRRLGT